MFRFAVIRTRLFSTSVLSRVEDKPATKQGFLKRILTGDHSKDYPTNAHSVLLANQDFIYDYQIHDVKPDKLEDYEKLKLILLRKTLTLVNETIFFIKVVTMCHILYSKIKIQN
jgi:hypothetical protein